MAGTRNDALTCSFCGKNQSQVLKLIAGPGVYICDECICLCVDIIAEEMAEQDGEEATVAGRLHGELEQLRSLIVAKRRH